MRPYTTIVCVLLLEVLGNIPHVAAREPEYSFPELGQDAGPNRRVRIGQGSRGQSIWKVANDPKEVIAPGSIVLDVLQTKDYKSTNRQNVTVEAVVLPTEDFKAYVHKVKGKTMNLHRHLKNSLPLPLDVTEVQQVTVYFWRFEPTKPILLEVRDRFSSFYLSINKLKEESFWARDSKVFTHKTVNNELLERLDNRLCVHFDAAPVDITQTASYPACDGEVTVSQTPIGDGQHFKITHKFPKGVRISRVSDNGGPNNILLPGDAGTVFTYFPKIGLNKFTSEPLLVEAVSKGSDLWFDRPTKNSKVWERITAPTRTSLEETLDLRYCQHYGFVTFDISLEPEHLTPTASLDVCTRGLFDHKQIPTPDNGKFIGLKLTSRKVGGVKVDAYRNRKYIRNDNRMYKQPSDRQTGLPTGNIKTFTMYNCSGEALGCYIEFANPKDTGWYHKIKNSNTWTRFSYKLAPPGTELECKLRIMLSQAGCGTPCTAVDIFNKTPYTTGEMTVSVKGETAPDIFNKYVHVVNRSQKAEGVTYKGEYLTLRGTDNFLPLVNDNDVKVTVYFWRRNLDKPLLMEVAKGTEKIWYENNKGHNNTVWEKTTRNTTSILVYTLDQMNCLLNEAYVLNAALTKGYLSNCNNIHVEEMVDPYNRTSGYIRYTHTSGRSPFTVSKIVIGNVTQEGMEEFPIGGVVKVCVFYPRGPANHLLIYVETKTGGSSKGEWYRKDLGIRTEL